LNTSLIKSILENLLVLVGIIGIIEGEIIEDDVPIIDELEDVSVLLINFISFSSFELKLLLLILLIK
jgi:hypothetical protein